MLNPEKKAIVSVIFGIISIIPGLIYTGIASWIIESETTLKYLEKYFFIFFPLALVLGFLGLKIGKQSFKSKRIAIMGIVFSILGIIINLFLVWFGLYTAQF